jgi:tetratricopeptide (TPR) repeat protein
VRICRLVGGMPLAIELAASWVRMLEPAEIADEMERSLDFLSATTRDVPNRHHSLRTIFEQSWQLLSADERRVLRELAVFRGGFSRDAARAVAGATLPLLAALVDKSLLLRIGPARYNLHELVRQYAAEQLAADAEEQSATRDRHSAYFVQFLADREQPLKSHRQLDTSMEIRVEIDNIRRAWERLVEQRRGDDLLRAGNTLHWFYEFRNWYAEGATVFQHAADALSGASSPAERTAFGHLLSLHGYFVMRRGELGQARELLGRALDVLEAAGSADQTSGTLLCLGLTLFQIGKYAEAGEYMGRGLALARQNNDRWNIGTGLFFLGTLAHGRGEYEAAQQLLHESLAVWREIGSPHLLSLCLNYLSITLTVLGKWSEAQAVLRDSLSVCAATEDRWGFATALNHLGQVAQALGDRHEARYLFEESLSIFRETGNRWDLARVHNHLGAIASEEARYAEARRHYETALALATEAQATPDALHAVIGLAGVLAATGQPATALELCLQCLAHPAAGNDARGRALRLRADLETQLSAGEIDAIRARAEGRSFGATVTELLPVHGQRHAVNVAA